MNKSITMLHPGGMGAAIGAGFGSGGHRVLWASADRGASTRKHAQAAGLEDMETLARAVQAADSGSLKKDCDAACLREPCPKAW